jgi:Ca-activated chloride channel family protein
MSESNPNRDELEDRLLDQALDELLGGKRPPDLSKKILQGVEVAQPVRALKWRRVAKYALAASLLVAVTVALLLPAKQFRRGTARSGATANSVNRETFERTATNVPVVEHAASVDGAVERLHGIDDPSLRDENRNGVFDPSSISNSEGQKIVPGQTMGGMGMLAGQAGSENSGRSGGGKAPVPPRSGPLAKGGYFEADEGAISSRAGGAGQGIDGGGEMRRNRIVSDEFARKKAAIEPAVSGLASIKTTPVHPNVRFDQYGRPIALPGGGGQVDPFGTSQGQGPGQTGDRHSRIVENPFLAVNDNPLSTFSIDVDTASYSKTRRYLMENNTLPPPDAVRIEELVNYFSYDYFPPTDDVPFAAHVEVAACPWRPEHRLVRIGLKGKAIARDQRPAGNLVFLLDVSGSMQPEDKLPRVIRSMRMLVEQLGENDRVAIVVYAGASGLVLPSTPGYDKAKIVEALDSLHAGGSTNGGEGIRLAYDTAMQSFIRGGTNRVILCTDGDFNVGTTSTAELERLAEEKAKTGVFLTVLGYGMGNHNDDMLEKLADKGNGNYGYIDTDQEARKLLVDQLGGTLVTIAKDVKVQIEFNPRKVGEYRLIGYENRLLRAEDFNDDQKDAGEIGAGHTVTALYEIAPPAAELKTPEVDPLRYQQPAAPTEAAASKELLTLKLRYKEPDGQESKAPLVFPVSDSGHAFGQATADFKFAAAVAGFGMLLRDSAFKGNLTYDAVLEIAQESLGVDQHGYRAGFVELVRKAKAVGK